MVVQRHADGLVPAIGLAAVALVPWVAELWAHASTWIAFVVLTGGAVLLLMTVYPVEYEWAPFLLILAAGHVTAVGGLWRGIAVTVAGEAVIIAVWMNGNLAGPEVAIWAAGIAVGLDMGFVMRSQQLRIDAQAREHATRERQAVLEERHRIGREVHDLVAHSLSVTMLHLTAARREVDDAAEQGDGAHLEDARSALRDAERVGRQAMADIRSTVGFLGEDHESLTAAHPRPRGPARPVGGLPGRRPRRGVRRPRRSRPGPGDHRPRPVPHRPGVARQRRQARASAPRSRSGSTSRATPAS